MSARSNNAASLPEIRSVLRTVLVFCVLLGFVGIQVAAASHLHDDSSDCPGKHCCPVCHASHIPALAAGSEMPTRPVSIAAWRVFAQHLRTVPVRFAGPRSSRAPPA